MDVRIGFGVRFLDLNQEQREKLLFLLDISRRTNPKNPISADLVEDQRPAKNLLERFAHRMYSVDVGTRLMMRKTPPKNGPTS